MARIISRPAGWPAALVVVLSVVLLTLHACPLLAQTPANAAAEPVSQAQELIDFLRKNKVTRLEGKVSLRNSYSPQQIEGFTSHLPQGTDKEAVRQKMPQQQDASQNFGFTILVGPGEVLFTITREKPEGLPSASYWVYQKGDISYTWVPGSNPRGSSIRIMRKPLSMQSEYGMFLHSLGSLGQAKSSGIINQDRTPPGMPRLKCIYSQTPLETDKTLLKTETRALKLESSGEAMGHEVFAYDGFDSSEPLNLPRKVHYELHAGGVSIIDTQLDEVRTGELQAVPFPVFDRALVLDWRFGGSSILSYPVVGTMPDDETVVSFSKDPQALRRYSRALPSESPKPAPSK